MKRKRRVVLDEGWRNWREARYATRTMARVDRREMIVVWSKRSGGSEEDVVVVVVDISSVCVRVEGNWVCGKKTV